MVKTLLNKYGNLTKDDVMQVYEKYVKGKPHVVLSVLAKGQENLIAKENNYTIDMSHYKAPNYGYDGLKYVKAKDNFDRSKIPGNGPNPVVKVPNFWRKDLANGIKMIGTENTEIPVVTISISIPGGHLLQANDLSKVGLASLFARMMNEDTKNYTAEQFTNELQKLGSSVSVGSGTDEISFNVQTLKKNLDQTLALLEERMSNPKFGDEAFQRIKKQTMEGFKNAKSQPANVASDVIAKINFGPNNILGMNGQGTELTIPNITLQDIENYYNNYITTKGMKVVVVGDIKQDEVLSKLSFLNKFPNKKIELPKV